jgi:hypothetical protein
MTIEVEEECEGIEVVVLHSVQELGFEVVGVCGDTDSDALRGNGFLQSTINDIALCRTVAVIAGAIDIASKIVEPMPELSPSHPFRVSGSFHDRTTV